MDLQFFVALNMMAISGLVILIALVHRVRGSWPWIAVNAAVVAAGLLALTFAWEWSGVVVAAVFIPLIMAPGILSYLAQRGSLAGRVREAARYSKLAAVLHPTARARFGAALSQTMIHEDTDRNVAALAELASGATPEQRAVIAAMQARERAQWLDVLEILRSSPDAASGLASLRLRALGEVGRIGEMIRFYDSSKTAMASFDLHMAQLFLMAFTGRIAAVELMLSQQFSRMDVESKAYWSAVAGLHSPEHTAAAREQLARLAREAKSARTRRAAERYLGMVLSASRQPLPETERRMLDETQSRIVRAARLADLKLSRLPATAALLVLNIAAFAVSEYKGGSEDLEVLVNLGALWPPSVWEGGEWWRIVMATFLHFGPVHLCANMFMLFLLGRMVEATFGWWRFLIIYMLGGVGSTAFVMGLMLNGWLENGVLIGASGAIFAVFGAEAARQISNWRYSRDALDKGQLVNLALILLVQVVIDFSVPQISAAAHTSGFLIGLVLGLLLNPAPATGKAPGAVPSHTVPPKY